MEKKIKMIRTEDFYDPMDEESYEVLEAICPFCQKENWVGEELSDTCEHFLYVDEEEYAVFSDEEKKEGSMEKRTDLVIRESIVKSQIEEKPEGKEIEFKFLTNYDDFAFAILWKDRASTPEEIEKVRKYIMEDEGRSEDEFDVIPFDIYLEELYEYIKENAGTLANYVDETLMIDDDYCNSVLYIVQTPSGYAAVKLWD